MLTVDKIENEKVIARWLRWIFELKTDSQKQKVFRANAMKVFQEAIPPQKSENDKSYYLIRANGKEQLLVKLNWNAPLDTINIAGFVRIKRGKYSSDCLRRLIDDIIPECRKQNKKYLCARSISDEGRWALFRLLKKGDFYDNQNSFRFCLSI